ncbi:hypothetical protein [Stutzerimonas nitrititolerans]|uniref:hypothetical protein n=1 Tax=Stutzerimonas nitrititolerans TaxID=2482751 RepID=UPI0028993C95|nr:hypothetical protein [Stutzerimonas nitrititolerans]
MQNSRQEPTSTADVLDRKAIREQFGDEKLALVLKMRVAGDELADAVVHEEH